MCHFVLQLYPFSPVCHIDWCESRLSPQASAASLCIYRSVSEIKSCAFKVPPSKGSLSSPPVRSLECVFMRLVLMACKSFGGVVFGCSVPGYPDSPRRLYRPDHMPGGASPAPLLAPGWAGLRLWALPAFLGAFWVCFVSLINYVTFSAGSYEGLRVSFLPGIFFPVTNCIAQTG